MTLAPPAPSGVLTPGNRVPDSFWAQVLIDIGAPVNATNIASLRKWASTENTTATWNPLGDTTNRLHAPSTIFNSAGVKNYQSSAAGAAATAAEMQAIAGTVVGSLRQSVPWQQWTKTQADQIAHWGSHGFANDILGIHPAQAAGTGSNTPVSTSTGQTACINSLAEYGTSHPSVVPGTQFLGWFFQPCILKRAGLMILGTGLIIFGLKQLGVKGPANQVIQARDKVFVGSGTRAPNASPKFTSDVKVEKPSPTPVAEPVPSTPPPSTPTPKIRTTTPSGRPHKPRDLGKVLAP